MPASEFSHFVDMCEKVRQTASKNAKVTAIAEYLIKLKDADGGSDTSLAAAVLFMSGAIFPKGSGLALNVGFNTVMRSLSEIARLEPEEIQRIYLKHGDMGALAEYVVSKRQQSPLVVQQLLHLVEIDPALQECRRKRMSQVMELEIFDFRLAESA